jgi:hypothetical protein
MPTRVNCSALARRNLVGTSKTYDADLGRDGVRRVVVRCATLARVLALAVLADDHPVEIAAGTAFQRALGALEDSCWTHVHVLVQRFADREDQAPEGDVVRDVWPAHGAEVNRVELLELREAVRRHVPAALQVVLGAPVEGGEVEGEGAEGGGEGGKDANRCGGYIDADAIAGDAGDAVDWGAGGVDVGRHCGRLCRRLSWELEVLILFCRDQDGRRWRN